MRLRSLLGLLGMCAAAYAAEQDACQECKTAALADASQCQAIASPDPSLIEGCEKKFSQATQACQESVCRADPGAQAATHCAECLKQVDLEARKCASLPYPVRTACEALAAGMKKTCDDKACPAPKGSEKPPAGEK